MPTPPTLQLHDLRFALHMEECEIAKRIDAVAEQIGRDYANRTSPPIFLGVLNGSFHFLSELVGRIEWACEVTFIKLASYSGTASTGEVSELIGLGGISLEGRDVIIVEDIVDTGGSIEHLTTALAPHAPASVAIATLLLKAEVYQKTIPINYCALEVPNLFVVGYGLDYNGLGRNYKALYVLDEQQ